MALTAKQEMFCQALVVRGMTQTAAYSHAYETGKMTPKSVHDASSKLAGNPEVAQRIAVLRERATAVAVKKAAITLADCIADADKLLDDAQSLGQISAGVAAAKLKAQLSGHLVERKEVTNKGPLEAEDVDKLLKLKQMIDGDLAAAHEAAELVGMPSAVVSSSSAPVRRVA